jgi:DNA-binding CsgD family transcriptional regulator
MSCTSTPARSPRSSEARVVHRNYARRRARQIAYGRWHPWADAAPVRDHVRQLRQAGASYRAIADAADVSPSTVRNLITGCQRQSRQVPNRIGAAQAQRLLAIRPATCGRRRNACGSRRRLQALVALGHSPAELARQLAISQPRLHRLLHGETQRVSTDIRRSVNGLYGRLWNQQPSERTRRQRTAAEAARHHAKSARWPPPMALDDDKIDDPAYRPKAAWRQAMLATRIRRPG